jgi:hypothetical protein
MGIQKSGILGPFRNKVGAVVGRRHRGQDLMTGLPRKSNKPATAKQLEAQHLFGLLNSFLSSIDQLVNIGFKAFVKNNSPVNAAFAYNYDQAFVKEDGQYRINYPKLVYSRGHMVTPEGAQVSSDAGKITFSWLPQTQSAYCQHTDQASFLAYHPVKEKVMILRGAVNRYAQSFVMEMPANYAGDAVHCYMSFASADGKLQGDSLYIGEVTVV